MEDVRPDDLGGLELEGEEQRQAEEDTASDGREPDDEAAEEADRERDDLVPRRQLDVVGADAGIAKEALRDQADPSEQQRDAEHRAADRLDPVAVLPLEVRGERHARERHRSASEQHPPGQPSLDVAERPLPRRSDRLEDRAMEDVRADGGRRVEAENEDEDRRHQRAATHAGQPDEHADQEPGERELPGHVVPSSTSTRAVASLTKVTACRANGVHGGGYPWCARVDHAAASDSRRSRFPTAAAFPRAAPPGRPRPARRTDSPGTPPVA